METMVWITTVIGVAMVVFGISTLVLSMKNEALKSGNANLMKLYDEKNLLLQESHQQTKTTEEALDHLLSQIEEEALQYYSKQFLHMLSDSILQKKDPASYELLIRKIKNRLREFEVERKAKN